MDYGISLQKHTGRPGAQDSETDADAAFDESWVLAELIALGPQALIEQVACVDNRLDFAGEHPPAWQILSNGQA